MEIRATSGPWHEGIEMLIRDTTNGKRAVARNIELEEVKEGHFVEPTMTLSKHAAQQLMDDLWQAGLRPSEGSGSAGSLRATEKHLEDMRKIAFNKLKISS